MRPVELRESIAKLHGHSSSGHSSFQIDDEPALEDEDDAVDELVLAWSRLQDLGEINDEAVMDDYMHIDDQVITDCAQTLKEIVDEIADKDSQLADSKSIDVEEEDIDLLEPPITSLEAFRGMK
uniref:Uncharacterized protein n=1 Tax=Ditylenchus dipsaci TaxID=166011 RepID=A0A915DET6_9BILA